METTNWKQFVGAWKSGFMVGFCVAAVLMSALMIMSSGRTY